MTDHVFRVRPQNPQCQKALCLEDYEAAWRKHQHFQFERVGGDFEKFRTQVWGKFSYADGMLIRVGGRQEQTFSWSDVASDGRIEFSDIQGLMELGLVEFLAPSHRCLSSRLSPNWNAWPIRNRRDFEAMVKEMQGLDPLHREGMGNVFWPLCLPDETLQGIASTPPPALPFILGTEKEEEEEYCDGGEVDFFDEDLGQAICEEGEPPTVSEVMKIGIGNLVSASVGYGMGFAIAAAAAPEIEQIFGE